MIFWLLFDIPKRSSFNFPGCFLCHLKSNHNGNLKSLFFLQNSWIYRRPAFLIHYLAANVQPYGVARGHATRWLMSAVHRWAGTARRYLPCFLTQAANSGSALEDPGIGLPGAPSSTRLSKSAQATCHPISARTQNVAVRLLHSVIA